MKELDEVQGRRTIPFDKVKEHCDIADKIGDGMIFHHTYTNSDNEKCTNLSPFNTQPKDPKFITLMKAQARKMRNDRLKEEIENV